MYICTVCMYVYIYIYVKCDVFVFDGHSCSTRGSKKEKTLWTTGKLENAIPEKAITTQKLPKSVLIQPCGVHTKIHMRNCLDWLRLGWLEIL